MPEQRETYKGKEVVANDDATWLTIGGTQVEVSLDERSGRYQTRHLPYTDYESVLELAKQMIDNVPRFRSA